MERRNRTLFFFILLALLTGKVMAQDVNPLFENELKFCKLLTESGYSNAFIKYCADDGIMFLPTPKRGREYYQKNPNDFKGLIWHAEFSEISADGLFGYTTGPWVSSRVSKTGDTTKSFGHFNTVWQKINGEWKFLIDCGISYGKKLIPADKENNKALIPVPKPEIKRQRFVFEDLIVRDNDFNNEVFDKSHSEAYKKFASENIRVYRDKVYPTAGLKKSAKLLNINKLEYMHMGGNAANSGDFAFTYGVCGRTIDTPEFSYMRIWKKEGAEWKIVLDVLSPIKK